MSYYLNVPFVTQLGIGAHVNPKNARNDPTGCWYASLCMLGYYFEAGPRLGNPDLFTRNLDKTKHGTDIGHHPIGGDDEMKMMQNENLVEVPEPADKKWKGWQIERMLKEYGPLMMSWHAPGAHVSVVIGISTGTNEVIYHDPENGSNSRMSLNDFNSKLMWGQRALMHRRKDKRRVVI